jgi:hypothetical protein
MAGLGQSVVRRGSFPIKRVAVQDGGPGLERADIYAMEENAVFDRDQISPVYVLHYTPNGASLAWFLISRLGVLAIGRPVVCHHAEVLRF